MILHLIQQRIVKPKEVMFIYNNHRFLKLSFFNCVIQENFRTQFEINKIKKENELSFNTDLNTFIYVFKCVVLMTFVNFNGKIF